MGRVTTNGTFVTDVPIYSIYRPTARRPIVQVGDLRADSDYRTLDHTGWLSWNSQRVYVTSALAGHRVRLARAQTVVAVWFYD